jgi:plastocyanin
MRARAVFTVVLVACIAGAGCSNGARVAASSPAPSTTAGPSASGGFNSYGNMIAMTDTGFQPQALLANPGVTITWVNHTQHDWTVIFDHQAVRSKTIPAGGTFTWMSPTPISVTYHDGNDRAFRGTIQVQGA